MFSPNEVPAQSKYIANRCMCAQETLSLPDRIATVLSLQATSINGTEFDAPEADRFAADGDASSSKKVFYIAEAEIDAMVEPYAR